MNLVASKQESSGFRLQHLWPLVIKKQPAVDGWLKQTQFLSLSLFLSVFQSLSIFISVFKAAVQPHNQYIRQKLAREAPSFISPSH